MTKRCAIGLVAGILALVASAMPAWASAGGEVGPALGPVPVAFVLFGLTLLGVALFHRHTLRVAAIGLVVITAFKLLYGDLHPLAHLRREWVLLANLLALLTGFDILAHHFSASKVPAALPRLLPRGWLGPFVLLALIWVLSGFLDNIAAAMIGAAVAATVFRGRVHIGYLAAVVAASNAGGAGSVVGDTTTTMLWIGGVSPRAVFPAYLAAVTALAVSGIVGSIQQHRHHPIAAGADREPIDWGRVAVVAFVLALAIGVNVTMNVRFPDFADAFPWIGAAVWLAILVTAPFRRPHWGSLPAAFRGSLFLLCLVACASMMPVQSLPAASPWSALGLGFVSAVFDNIPLTKLALDQGGYDWAFLAFAVGYGGSLVWFGSSAGVAVSNYYPQAKSVAAWVRHGWHVALAYVAGFLVLFAVRGWHPPAAAGAEKSAPPRELRRPATAGSGSAREPAATPPRPPAP